MKQDEQTTDGNSRSYADSRSEEENELCLQEQEKIKDKLQQIKGKARKRAVRETEQKRLLRKKISKSTKTVVDTHGDIGDVIEKIVQDSDVGADQWRRTGVYTFSGDIKSENV